MLAGDLETGVSLMQLEAGLDTGPVFASTRLPIAPTETAGELRGRLVEAATELLLAHLPALPTTTPEPQHGEPTYADKLEVDEFRLDTARPAAELARLVRAGNPRPGAWFTIEGKRVKVLRAHESADGRTLAPGEIASDGALGTARDVLILDEVQPQGKRSMDGRAWRAGVRGRARADTP
jgi:methionyl-tRNA formyltransferase